MMMMRLGGELLGREELSDSSRMVSVSSFDVPSSKFEIFAHRSALPEKRGQAGQGHRGLSEEN